MFFSTSGSFFATYWATSEPEISLNYKTAALKELCQEIYEITITTQYIKNGVNDPANKNYNRRQRWSNLKRTVTVTLTVFKSSFLLFVTFDIMIGR